MGNKKIKEPMKFLQELMDCLVGKSDGKDIQIDLQKIVKANDVSYHAIVLKKGEKDTVGKCFNVEGFYKEHLDGTPIEEIAVGILEMAGEDGQIEGKMLWEMLSNYENIKEDRLIIKLLNPEKNREYLKEVCHVPYLDLEAVVYVLYSRTEDDIKTISITAPILKMWGISEKQLLEDAVKSMERMFPVKIYSVFDVLGRLLKNKAGDDFFKDMNQPGDMERLGLSKDTEIFVMTNDAEINGAATILYPDVLKKFAKAQGITAVNILPSSVDEVILVPDRSDTGERKEELIRTIKEVNAMIEPKEMLSDSLYVCFSLFFWFNDRQGYPVHPDRILMNRYFLPVLQCDKPCSP